MTENEVIHLLALMNVPGVGDVTAKKLIGIFGKPSAVFQEREHIGKIDGLNVQRLGELLSNKAHLDNALREWELMQRNNISHCTFLDETYPELLRPLIDSPPIFFHKGDISWRNKRMISIVGTRHITPQGHQATCELVEALSVVKDILIVSGFAYGVDITAHKKALELGIPTIACLAHGLDKIYPASHKKYAEQMLRGGCFITDFWHESPFVTKNFARRNRIIAGLSEATIVVESASKGGSLVTANYAFNYNREVFALPGRPTDIYSQGCNELIKQQKAQLISSGEDVLQFLGWNTPQKNKEQAIQMELFRELSEKEARIHRFLQESPKQHLEIIAQRCELSIFEASSVLFEMEMSGIIRALPGKLFSLA